VCPQISSNYSGAVQLESGRVRKMTETKIPAAIRVDWWYGERVLEGEEELRAELAENYAVSIVRTRRGGLGGGLYQLFVEFLSQLTLQEVARVLLEGVAFDLIKSGTKIFFIRPFLDAYQRFKSRQKEEKRAGIDRFRLVFQDAAITIENLPHTDMLGELGNILQAVAENLEPMTRGTKGQLFEVFIPVFEDTSDERVCKFRTLLRTDETLDVSRISRADYFKFWGLDYYGVAFPSCVYDVEHKATIHEQFCTESQYWNSKMYTQKRGGA